MGAVKNHFFDEINHVRCVECNGDPALVEAPPASQDRAGAPTGSSPVPGLEQSRSSTGAAFTPGPWEHVPATEHHGHYVSAPYGGDICDLYAMSDPSAPSTRNGGTSKPLPFRNAEANANLIAAAPELFEALRELLVAVRYADPPRDFGTDGDPNLCHEARIPVDFVTVAERAIAKAQGK